MIVRNVGSVVAALLVLSGCAYKASEESFTQPTGAPPDANSAPHIQCTVSDRFPLRFPAVLGTGADKSRVYADKIEACVQRESAQNAPVDIAAWNSANMQKYWAEEFEFYHRKTEAAPRPRSCLALSGGGIRAAAYAMGVMKALDNMQRRDEPGASVLESLDIISSVSGGSYASSWYYVQRDHYNNFSPFKPLSCQAENANTLGYEAEKSDAKLTRQLGIAFTASGSLAFAPFNLLFNGVLGTHSNLSWNPLYYETKLHKIFHSGKAGELSPQLTMAAFKELVKNDATKPYFIFNTTASNRFYNEQRYDQNAGVYKRLYENYEFTPRYMGNERFGYTAADEPYGNMPLKRVIAMSGAAGDTMTMSEHWLLPRVASVINQDLGQYIENYNMTKAEQNAVKWKYAPFPLHFMYFDTHGDLVTDIYMSDGGHSENLGFYPLIKRGCENIIVVDAERDAGYKFKSLARLRWKLKRLGIDLNFDDLLDNDPFLDVEDVYDERKAIAVPGDRIAYRDINGAITNLSKPVFHGTIENMPVPGAREDAEINVTYIKLSVDPDVAERGGYGKNVQDQFEKCKGKVSCFPHPSTADQNFPGLMFNALRDLGCETVEKHLDREKVGGVNDGASLNCLDHNKNNKDVVLQRNGG